MTILTTGAYDLPAAADRNRNSMMLAKGPTPLSVIDGVHSGLNITKSTGMGFLIAPGRAAVNGTSAAEGTFTVAVTASEAGAFADGDSTKDRFDLVILRTYPGNPSATGAKVEVVKGAVPASGEPAVPATPAGALALFVVRITAGMSSGNGGWNTSKVTDVRRAIGVPEFVDYTPTWTGFVNIGSGAIRTGRYRVDGDKCSVSVKLVGGSGADMSAMANLAFSLPIPAASGFAYYGMGALHHTSGAYHLQVHAGGSSGYIWAVNPASSPANNLVHPGLMQYPYGQGTEIFANLEYIIDLP